MQAKDKKLRLTPAMNIYTMWGRERLIELVEMQNDIETNRLQNKESTGQSAVRIAKLAKIATEQYLGGEVGQLEGWKVPANHESVDTLSLYLLAASVSFSAKWGEYLTPAQMNYLCHLDAGDFVPGSFTKFIEPEVDEMLKNNLIFDSSRQEFDLEVAMDNLPPSIGLKEDAWRLAFAFYMTMLDKTKGSIPHPFLGEFRMTKTGVDMIDDLNLSEIRLVISQKGIWLSAILPNGNYCASWWCPDGDSLMIHFGYRFTWVFRTFLACLWHDLHHVDKRTFVVKTDKAARRTIQPSTPKEKIIMLPRTQRTIQWAEAMKHVWERGEGEEGKRTWPVRAHYRLLEEGHYPSEQAIQNALDWHFPEPPFGYTFVKPFEPEGSEGQYDRRPPRIIAKGLQALKVALARF